MFFSLLAMILLMRIKPEKNLGLNQSELNPSYCSLVCERGFIYIVTKNKMDTIPVLNRDCTSLKCGQKIK